MSAKKDTVTVELPRDLVEWLSRISPSSGGSACRAALEEERAAERDAWVEERDQLLGGWNYEDHSSGFGAVWDQAGYVVCMPNGVGGARGIDSSRRSRRRARLIASAPDMAALLERLVGCKAGGDPEVLRVASEALALLRSNEWLPPEGE